MTAPAKDITVHHAPSGPARQLEDPDSGDKLLALLNHKEAKARIGPLLSPGDDYERIVAVIGRAARHNPDILTCTGTSILDAAATIVGWRLEIGETAYLVPFRDRDKGIKVCTPIMGYTGMCQLLIASGAARYVEPWCVYWNETFELIGGSESRIVHVPGPVAERTTLRGAYVIVHLRFGARAFKWMPIEDIDVIRSKSQKWSKGPCPPWYAMKTAIRQMAKLLPKTRDVAKAFAFIRDEERAELGAPDEADTLELARPAVALASTTAPSDAPLAPSRSAEPARPAEPPPLTLELALDTPLRGGPKTWNGNGGKRLRDVPPSVVKGARDFFTKVLNEAIAKEPNHRDPDLERHIAALGLVHALRLDEAEREQMKLFESASAEGEDTESEAARLEKFAAEPTAVTGGARVLREIPADLGELKRWSTADLQATALATLKRPAFDNSRQGFIEQVNAGITHHQAVGMVTTLAEMLEDATPAGQFRRTGRLGDLPGDPA